MSHSVVLTDIFGDRVSVFPWSLHVRCSRYTCNGEVLIGYDIHASKDNVYSDDVTLKTPLLHSAEEAFDYIDVLLSNVSDVQQVPDAGGALCI